MPNVKCIVWIMFFLSGVSALVYEVIWTRQLTLVFGSTVFATSTVLTAFMAGLALGSFYFGRLADAYSRPLRLYAVLEAAIAAFAVVWPMLLDSLNAIYALAYRGLNAEFYSLSLIRFVLSFLLLLVPSTLMGATLPILSRCIMNRMVALGFNIGTLYALNTFGAVVGCISTGFFLIRFLGIQHSLWLAAVINFGISITAALLERHQRRPRLDECGAVQGVAPVVERLTAEIPLELRRMVLWAFALSGFCALSYEVLWTRILVFFLGSTTYAFSTMLAAFLFGIGMGSFAFSWIVDRLKSLVNIFGIVQIAIGLTAVALIPAFGGLYAISSMFQSISGGGRFWVFASCVIVMSVPTLLMGVSFPLVVRIFTVKTSRLGRSIGNVYAVNTVGAILGAFSAGFILIPLIGIRASIVLVAMLNAAVGFVLISRNEKTSKVVHTTAIGGTLLTVVLGVIILSVANRPLFLRSAIFRIQRPGDTIVDYKEEIDSTVTTLKDDEGVYRLYVDTNQAADASRWDSPSHRVIAHLPLLLHPNPERALVVGFGMGVTSYSITKHGVRVDAVEISNGVIDSAREHFKHVNHDVLQSSLFNHTINDGRNYILMTRQKYDMISTGIIHPLVSAGSSNIYSEDFYRLCQRILTETGIMCQWVPLHRLPEGHYKIILRTFLKVFPNTTLWYKYTPDFVILIGTREPLKINYKEFLAKSQIPNVANELLYDNLDGTSLLDSFMMGAQRLQQYVGDGPIHTDNRPQLDFFRSQSLNGTTEKNIFGMAKHREPVMSYLVNYGDTMEDKMSVRRQLRLYFEASQNLIQGQIEYAKGEYDKAIGLMNQAVVMNPEDDTISYNFAVVADLVREEEQDELRQLEHLVKQTLRKNPNDVEGHFHLALIYEGQGNLREAAKALETAIGYAPRFEFFILLGPIYERQERFDEALRTYQRLEALDSTLPVPILLAMASIYHRMDAANEALSYAKKALQTDKDSWRGHYLLGSIYSERGQYEKAVQSYVGAIEKAPTEPLPHISLTQLYLTRGQFDSALDANAKALRLVPSSKELQEQSHRIRDERTEE